MIDDTDEDGVIPPGPPEPAITTQVTGPALGEEQDIAYVQNVRRQIVQLTLANGKLPEDKDRITMLMHSLDGLDRSATARMRIKSESENAKGMVGAAAVIAQMLNSLGGGAARGNQVVEMEPPSLPLSIAPVINKGEMLQGTHPVRAGDFAETGVIEPLPDHLR